MDTLYVYEVATNIGTGKLGGYVKGMSLEEFQELLNKSISTNYKIKTYSLNNKKRI